MCDDDRSSLSLVPAGPDITTLYTPSQSDQETDEFEFAGDSNDNDGEWLEDLASSRSTSVFPSVYAHEFDHGRRYHSFKSGRYPLPNDEAEQLREETMHALMLQVTEGYLFYADVGENPQKIIDIGTGTGTWAIDVADMYPSASVVGTDLSPIQPTWLPVNVRMFLEDCEEPDWLHGGGFDLVHFRGVAGTLRDLDALLAKVYPNLNTGGWIEFQEFMPQVLCDDGSMKAGDPLQSFVDTAVKGMRRYGCSAYGSPDLKDRIERAGFNNVQVVTKKVPVSTWPRDKKERTVGLLMKEMVLESLAAYTAKPLDALHMPQLERQELVNKVRASLEDLRIHRYVNCCFYLGQKGDLASDSESYL